MSARCYAEAVLKNRWPEAEDTIFRDTKQPEQKDYYLFFLKRMNVSDEQKVEWLSTEGRSENLLGVLAYIGWPAGMDSVEHSGPSEPLFPEIVRYFHSSSEEDSQNGTGVFVGIPHLRLGKWNLFFENGKVYFKKWTKSTFGHILVQYKFPCSVKETLEDISTHPYILDEWKYPWPKHAKRFEVFKRWLREECES